MSHPSFVQRIHPQTQAAPGRGRWLALLLLCAAQFMLILDITVINIALPQIAGELGLDSGSASWAITAYVIPFGGLLLFGGRLSDLLGSRRVFLVGLILFTVSSLLAGFAGSVAALLLARAGQGIGAALLSPSALATVTGRFAGAERHRALAIWGAVGAVGAAAGVLVGGLLTDGPGWRWIFFINIPVGVVVAIVLPLVVPAVTVLRSDRRMDLVGAVLVTLGVGSLIYGITSIGDTRQPVGGIALIIAAVVLFALFIVRERTAADPLLDLEILARRPVRAGIVVMLAASALLVGSFFLLSFILQNHHGWSPLVSGLAFLPVALATLAGAHLSGRLVSHAGGRAVATSAFVFAAIGTGMAALTVDVVPLLITGVSVAAVGLGASFVAATTTAMSQAQPDELGITSAVINTFHELGAALGVATLSVVAASSLASPRTVDGFVAAFVTAGVAAAAAALASLLLVPAGKPATDTPRFMH